jgi:fructokinase
MEYAHTCKNFLSFGEVLWDIIDGKPYIGGAPFNVAAHLANCGANSYMLSRLGKDELGKQAFVEIQKLNVKTSLIQWDDIYPTGTVEVFIDNGQPDYVINENVAYDYISTAAMPPPAELLNFHCLYFGTLAQRNSASRETLHWILTHLKFKTVFYDVNLRKGILSKELIVPSLGYCNIFKLNNEEVEVISNLIFHKSFSLEDFAREISRNFNIEVIIITAGEKGCYLYQAGVLTFVAGEKVRLIDGVGAGDAFSAAFLFYFVECNNALRSAGIANKLGAFVASCRGPIPPYSEEIRTQLNNARLWEL